MLILFGALIVFAFIVVGIDYCAKAKHKARQQRIQSYQFPPAIAQKIKDKYPHLNDEQIDTVFDGLRDYFWICHQAGRRIVAMPSQVVDLAWHEFILYTQKYALFCDQALGRFLHHTPAEAMTTPTQAQAGIKRTWRLACYKDGITPHKATHLPLVFAIDKSLNIEDGFHYSLHCDSLKRNDYCANQIGNIAGCSGVRGCTGGETSCSGSSCSGGGCGGGGD